MGPKLEEMEDNSEKEVNFRGLYLRFRTDNDLNSFKNR
jgi:hypothetical protein